MTTLIRRKTVLEMVPLSDRTIFDMEKRGEFPTRIVLTKRSVAWNKAEIEAWLQTRAASSEKASRPNATERRRLAA